MVNVSYPAIPAGPPSGVVSYTLDAVGNQKVAGSKSYGYDASDRITNTGFVYDTNGNLTSDGVISYSYDAANRLTKVVSGSMTTTYGYDGWGNLVREVITNGVSVTTTDFVLDESGGLTTILGEIRGSTERLYAYGPDGFAAQKLLTGTVEYPLLDNLGSVRRLVNITGTIILTRSYDAYGVLRQNVGSGFTRLGYTGELQDATTGLVYLRARFYHTGLARFLQRDGVAGFLNTPQTLNRYAYTGNNPGKYRDPSGHCFFFVVDGLFCAAAAFGVAIGGGFYYGMEVGQNIFDEDRTGWDALTNDIDWSGVAWAGGETGLFSGIAALFAPLSAALVGGTGLGAAIAAGVLDGVGAGTVSHSLINLLRGCPWNNGIGGAAAGGGLGGGLGPVLGKILGVGVEYLAKNLSPEVIGSIGNLINRIIYDETGAVKIALKPGEAGRFKDLNARAIVGDDLTPHHMPQAAAKFTTRDDGGALMMTTAEHELTRTFKGKGNSTLIEDAALSFREILAKDIQDVRNIVGSKYNEGIRDLLEYYRQNFPNLITK